MLQHLTGNVASDIHDRLVTDSALGQFGDQRMPGIVQSALNVGPFLTYFQALFSVVTGRHGSKCFDFPNGNKYQFGSMRPNRSSNQFACFESAPYRTLFSGMVRPSPAAVLLVATTKNRFCRSTFFHCIVRISLLRIPVFWASINAGKIMGDLERCASTTTAAFSPTRVNLRHILPHFQL
jgi:hypothetical protein